MYTLTALIYIYIYSYMDVVVEQKAKRINGVTVFSAGFLIYIFSFVHRFIFFIVVDIFSDIMLCITFMFICIIFI